MNRRTFIGMVAAALGVPAAAPKADVRRSLKTAALYGAYGRPDVEDEIWRELLARIDVRAELEKWAEQHILHGIRHPRPMPWYGHSGLPINTGVTNG